MLTIWVEDSLKKVFQDDGPTPTATRSIELAAARNEREDAQICVRTNVPVQELSVSFSPLAGPDGAVLPETVLRHAFVGYVPLHENTADNGGGAHIIRRAPDFFPDPFIEWPVVKLLPGLTQPIWVTVAVPEEAPAGDYHGTVTVRADAETAQVPIQLRVHPFSLPRKPTLWLTNWFTTSCLERWYGVERFSPRWWELVETAARDMGAHRQNIILTPLFDLVRIRRAGQGYTYDYAALDRWISLFDRYGVAERIEGSHLGGRAGDWESEFVFGGLTVYGEDGTPERLGPAPIGDANRRALLRDFLQSLKAHLMEKGWWSCFILHQADEPIPANEPSYRQLADFVRATLPDVPRVDAVMSHGVEGCLEIRVPQVQELSDDPRPPHEELWFYTCLAPQGPYPNRFVDFSSLKTRILHWLNWRYQATGYLHWGYAHWSGWSGVAGSVDPWNNATGSSERLPVGKLRLPPGDPHVVYPGHDGVCSSIRWEMVRKGSEDYEYLMLLEERIRCAGEQRPEAAQARALLDEIRQTLLRSHSEYTRDDSALLDARRRLANAILSLS